jgi:hypothetical protein
MSTRGLRGVLLLGLLGIWGGPPGAAAAGPPKVELVKNEAEHRVDVLVDKKPFTSYSWVDTVKKPILFPVRTAKGTVVTRGFPLEPRPGESHDHPHHTGFWFNYGDVDGVDFWGNHKDARGGANHKLGSIVHRGIGATRGGAGRGELEAQSAWVNGEGAAVLLERTRYVFGASEGRRSIDRIARLEALAPKVSFLDNKEGMLGLRVAKELELPGKKNAEATGQYRSSEGKVGDAVWGTRARWVMLTGKVEGEPVTLALFDHPTNPGYPTHWHARGYGLFAANPMGAQSLGGGKETADGEGKADGKVTAKVDGKGGAEGKTGTEAKGGAEGKMVPAAAKVAAAGEAKPEKKPAPVSLALTQGKSARFAYRLVILSSEATPEAVEAEYQRFLKEVK